MDGLWEQLDETVLNIFQVLDDLYEKQAFLNQTMKDGFLHMSRARYSIGMKRIEANILRDANLEANRTVVVHTNDIENLSSLTSDSDSDIDHKLVHKDLFEMIHHPPIKKIIDKKKNIEESETLLRKRGVNKPEATGSSKEDKKGKTSSTDKKQVSAETQGLDEGEDSRKVTNPIKLFGVLVPQPLRFSQKSFEAAVQLSVEIADLKFKLLHLQKQIKVLKQRKKDLGSSDDSVIKAVDNEA